MKERSSIRSESKEPDAETAGAAALKIQKIWRGYSTRGKIRQRKLEEMLLIGKDLNKSIKTVINLMIVVRYVAAKSHHLRKLEVTGEHRKGKIR